MANFFTFDIKQIFTVTMILFAIIDIIGSVPIVISLRQKAGQIQSGKATIVSGALMLIFLFLGDELLKLIGLDVASFAIAGSLVIFVVAMEMILGVSFFKDEQEQSTVSIVPLAFPLIAGAGTMTTLLSLKSEYATQNIVVAILINMGFVFLVLKNTVYIERLLGVSGLHVLRKAFGVILLAIAIKLFRTNTGF